MKLKPAKQEQKLSQESQNKPSKMKTKTEMSKQNQQNLKKWQSKNRNPEIKTKSAK